MTVLVGKKAPNFQSPAVTAQGELITFDSNKIIDQYILLFFYPLDFTFVCPSELIALNNRINEFKKRNVAVHGISIDSQFTHNAWRRTPVNKGGIGELNYTLISDINHEICRTYGVEHAEAGVALRASFIIDKSGIVQFAYRYTYCNDIPEYWQLKVELEAVVGKK